MSVAERNEQIHLDFKLAQMIGKPTCWNAQHYIDGTPRSGWVLHRAPTKKKCQELIDSVDWDYDYRPQGHAANEWSPTTSLDNMAEVEERICKAGYISLYMSELSYLLSINNLSDIHQQFRLATAKVETRAKAAYKMFRKMGDDQEVVIPEYITELPDYTDLMSVKEFTREVTEYGSFNEFDGGGYPVKDGKMATNVVVFPLYRIPDTATHVAWFNK